MSAETMRTDSSSAARQSREFDAGTSTTLDGSSSTVAQAREFDVGAASIRARSTDAQSPREHHVGRSATRETTPSRSHAAQSESPLAHASKTPHASAWSLRLATLCSAASLALGCFVPRDRSPQTPRECTQCHGDATRDGPTLTQAAPPSDTFGNHDVAFPSVGAHALHLSASSRHDAVACAECHLVPSDARAPGHNDGVTQVVFGPIARGDGGAPTWDVGSRTCRSSGCHGAVSGVWTRPRPADDACGTCHALPPRAPHPQSTACAACHTSEPTGPLVLPSSHVNGVVDIVEPRCDACHGSADSPAPPRAVDGGTQRTSPSVGAHAAHRVGGQASAPVPCAACHDVPAQTVTPTHPNGGPAEVLERVGWNSTSQQCTTACHGGPSPRWTAADAALTCQGCHGAPPPLPHPNVTRCELCHAVEADGRPRRATHVDGRVDAQQPSACNGCHGGATNDAPPRDLGGSSDPARIGVGAHQSHVVGHGLSRTVPCAECHPVPSAVASAGHLNGVTEVRFTGVARSNQAAPTYSRPTCSNTACHDLSNISSAPSPAAPRWTLVDGSARQCTSCHAMPPPAPHASRADCWSCHLDAAPDGGFGRPDLHVNGRVDFALP